MHPLISLIQAHPAAAAVALYYLFSAIVSGMPSPPPNCGMGYLWAFNSLHTLAGNLGRVVMRNGNGEIQPK